MAPIPTYSSVTSVIGPQAKCCVDCSKDQDMMDENMNAMKMTPVQKFYSKKNVLVTGATGFLGKILMEKLLRCCDVENLYLLVRQKRGKDIYTRIDELFEDPVFNRLKEEFPKFRHRIVVVPADCEAAGLGLNITDRQMLIEKVNIIFHSAATVKFDEHLRAALATNVRAPLQLLRLARELKQLDVFMHISTAYSNSHLSHIEERFYDCSADADQLQRTIDKLTDREIDQLLPKILGQWPNTYTFTKALAEKELRVNAGGLPIGIFRPAIVTSTAKEPLKCWLDNMYGPTGVAVGSDPLMTYKGVVRGMSIFRYMPTFCRMTGILRTLQCDNLVTADIVPVDLVVNGLIVAAASVHNTRHSLTEPPIFNYVSSVENRITWGDFMAKNLATMDQHPLSEAVWYFTLTLTKSAILNRINIVMLHLIPAALVDGLAVCLGRKPKMMKVYRKIHKFSSVLSYFCTTEIHFCNKRVREMWACTTDQDQKLFPFSMSSINWDQYFDSYLLGIRRYLFKESDETLPAARIKWKRLFYLHQIARVLFYALAAYLMWSIFKMLW